MNQIAHLWLYSLAPAAPAPPSENHNVVWLNALAKLAPNHGFSSWVAES